MFQILISLFIFGVAQASILPPNNLKIPVNSLLSSDMTEELFNSTIQKVENVYAPIIAESGKRLVITRKWSDPTVNAYATPGSIDLEVTMFGGLARHKTITSDGLALVVCHEIGHHIGGAPKKGGGWASNEGQADYFATNKCLKRVFKGEDHQQVLGALSIPQSAKEQCSKSFKDEEFEICLRGSMAGMSVGNLFAALAKSPVPPQFDTRDEKRVSVVNDMHPAPQCRLDTYFAGASCTQNLEEDVSITHIGKGNCFNHGGLDYHPHDRPLCWFYDSGSTFLMDAIKNSEQHKVDFALARMKAVDLKEALLMAVKAENIAAIETLGKLNPNLNMPYEKKKTLIHYAIEQGSLPVVNKLIELKASLKVADSEGDRPIHYACGSHSPDMVKLILDNGASLEETNNSKMTAIYRALSGDLAFMDFVISLGANMNAVSWANFTPLINSITAQNLGMVDLLLKRGANPSLGGYNGNSPLHYAVRRKNKAFIELLVKAGADKKRRNSEGKTAYDVAYDLNLDKEILKLLR